MTRKYVSNVLKHDIKSGNCEHVIQQWRFERLRNTVLDKVVFTLKSANAITSKINSYQQSQISLKYPPKCSVRKLFTLLGFAWKVSKNIENKIWTMLPYRVQYNKSESDIKNNN